MWPFSKKWSPPVPQLAMIVGLAKRDLPSLVMLANPSRADGAVAGMLGPAEEEPTKENMLRQVKEGNYVGISPEGGVCVMQVERVDGPAGGLELEPAMLEAAGLTEGMLTKFNNPAWRVIIQMQEPAEDVRKTVVFATRLAQRLAALADGVVMDTCGYRFFGPEGWPIEDRVGECDAREHVHVHIETDERWFHTHGLVKFGRPEMEIYDVPAEMDQIAYSMLLNTAQYVIDSALIEPGQTCGDPKQAFYARKGSKHQKEHWNGVPVLEFVDVTEAGKPVASGAPKALKAFAAMP